MGVFIPQCLHALLLLVEILRRRDQSAHHCSFPQSQTEEARPDPCEEVV
jgi:hypothetical protein